jgi:hypothetical protein
MPLQNRVTPSGEIIATSARGTFMGNRGRLHDEARRIVRTSAARAWLICRLDFKGRRREVMSSSSYTELFFLDEAVALAAGHRPCGECRRESYRAYKAAVAVAKAHELDRLLNAARRAPRASADVRALPDGVFVTLGDNDFRLLWDGALHRWSPAGYHDPVPAEEFPRVAVVTPALSVAALQSGYPVAVHPSLGPPARAPDVSSSF